MSKHKKVTKWVGYVDNWFRTPKAYIFQAEFLETDKQYQYEGGRSASGNPETDVCRALGYKTRVNKSSNDCIFDTWNAVYANLLKEWTRDVELHESRLAAGKANLAAVLKLEQA